MIHECDYLPDGRRAAWPAFTLVVSHPRYQREKRRGHGQSEVIPAAVPHAWSVGQTGWQAYPVARP